MTGRFFRRRRSGQLAALLLLAALLVACASHTTHAAPPGHLTFQADFSHGLDAWTATGGGAQCANYGTPSTAPRLRGYFFKVRADGLYAGRFDLPASYLPKFSLEACELTHRRHLGLGTDDYYGYMFYVPMGWKTEARAFWGITTAQFHFQNIWGSPIQFELHNNHMTLAVQTGACRNHNTPSPGCRWHTNADNPGGNPGTLPAEYAVPPGMQQGVWHELVMHVHWASDNTGQIQVWHRVMGNSTWKQTVNLRGHPTVQWDEGGGCCDPWAVDKVGAYRGLAYKPVSVWETRFTIGTGFGAVAAKMPGPK